MMKATERIFAGCALLAALLVCGCGNGLGPGSTSSGWPRSSGNANGNVMGGQQPIAGATIQLYAVNQSSFPGAATALLTSTVTTDAGGNFDITGKYACPADALVYITAMGGNPGAGTNTKSALMTGLGKCSDLTPATFIQINEVTTVGTAFALQGFMLDATHVGAFAYQSKGLRNAFAMINALVDTAGGHASGPALPQGATIPGTKINALANVLAACVNTNGGTTACSDLFAATISTKRGTPANTITAALAMAAQPGLNVATLYNLQVPSPPFQPALTGVPHDWALAVTLSGNGLKTPRNVAIEAGGGAWVTNEAGNSATHFGPVGDATVTAANYTGSGTMRAPHGVWVDGSGNVWVASTGNDAVVKFSSTGTLLSGFGYTAGALNAPMDVVVDPSNNVWVANFGAGSVTKLSSTGVTSTVTNPLKAGGLVSAPTGIALGPAGLMHLASGGNGTVVSFDGSGNVLGGVGHSDSAMQGTAGIAVDNNGTIWVPQPGLNALTAIIADYTPMSGSPLKSAALMQPVGVAIDGATTVWVTNGGDAGSLTAVNGDTGVAVPGASLLGALQAPYGVAVDGSGYVWTANTGSDTVSVFVGVGAPAIVPIVARF